MLPNPRAVSYLWNLVSYNQNDKLIYSSRSFQAYTLTFETNTIAVGVGGEQYHG